MQKQKINSKKPVNTRLLLVKRDRVVNTLMGELECENAIMES